MEHEAITFFYFVCYEFVGFLNNNKNEWIYTIEFPLRTFTSPSGGVVRLLTPSVEWGLAHMEPGWPQVGHGVGTKFLVPVCCEGPH